MIRHSIFLFCLMVFLWCFSCSNKIVHFEKQYDKMEYHKIAKAKGISNAVWIDRLFDYKVNINKFDKFKSKGVNLNEIYAPDYKSSVLIADVVVEGEIISKKENPSRDVLFHTTYFVKVKNVLKQVNETLSDTIILKVTYGPVGNSYLPVTSGANKYEVGENVLLYLETMERTFKSYEENVPEQVAQSILIEPS